jgi:hypothetical protein
MKEAGKKEGEVRSAASGAAAPPQGEQQEKGEAGKEDQRGVAVRDWMRGYVMVDNMTRVSVCVCLAVYVCL